MNEHRRAEKRLKSTKSWHESKASERRRRKEPQPHPMRMLTLEDHQARRKNIFVARYEPTRVEHVEPHIHRFYELVFVEEGTGKHSIDGLPLDASAGDLFWISPGEVHDPRGLHYAVKWIVGFHPDVIVPGHAGWAPLAGRYGDLRLQPFAAPLQAATRRLQISAEDRAAFGMRLDQIQRELAEDLPGHEHVARALLELILVDLARKSIGPAGAEAPQSNPLIEAALFFIDQHFRRPIGLRDVARAVGRSPAYITDLIRRRTGRPVLQWIAERRIAEARYLLLTCSDMSVEEVAYAVGYGDSPHFCRQFRQRTGVSPGLFRANSRHGETVPKLAASAQKAMETDGAVHRTVTEEALRFWARSGVKG